MAHPGLQGRQRLRQGRARSCRIHFWRRATTDVSSSRGMPRRFCGSLTMSSMPVHPIHSAKRTVKRSSTAGVRGDCACMDRYERRSPPSGPIETCYEARAGKVDVSFQLRSGRATKVKRGKSGVRKDVDRCVLGAVRAAPSPMDSGVASRPLGVVFARSPRGATLGPTPAWSPSAEAKGLDASPAPSADAATSPADASP